ncbi:Eukaryotic/viral aspartic protease [Phytophthora megakarya]|uniref:Eukaryotic/viral aspartic protease n=1 Tax=Phytophthora megakarya TaxID=4795 RepID=A0A225URW0_9STRA|nr:Eukaryotic/viral aspartic protease [Phytophthora megakarya]
MADAQTRPGARSEVPDAGGTEVGEEEDLYKRPQQDGVLNEYIRQIEKASSPKGERSTQKIELAAHWPLGQIRAFSGLRNKSENSMQWLRGFVYEMNGIRASPDE